MYINLSSNVLSLKIPAYTWLRLCLVVDILVSIKINEMMRHRILTTCGDADVMVGTKHIDPLLRLYVGGYFMCIDNKHLSEGRGKGTLCRVIKMRLKETPKITAMNWEGRKVNTVNISEVH